MASYVVWDVVDIHGQVSPLRMRVTEQTASADIVTFAGAVQDAMFGATKPSRGGVRNVRLEIDGIITGTGPQTESDVRLNWQTSSIDDDLEYFRIGIPGRNNLPALYSSTAKDAAELTAAAWAAVSAAMFDGTIKVLSTKTGLEADGISKAFATARARKRLRTGSSR
jgi:hypothetical protein